MAKTWDLKLDKDRTIKVKALKKDTERVGRAIRDILNIHWRRRTSDDILFTLWRQWPSGRQGRLQERPERLF
jgi:diketogulonate reductase-like aldo/keto reductase